MQTDLEEEKTNEITKLQEALHAMQIQVEEANARVIKEREAARKAIQDAPPVIKETPVIIQDTEKIDSLTAEVESLKVGTHTLRIKLNWRVFFGYRCVSHYIIVALYSTDSLISFYELSLKLKF